MGTTQSSEKLKASRENCLFSLFNRKSRHPSKESPIKSSQDYSTFSASTANLIENNTPKSISNNVELMGFIYEYKIKLSGIPIEFEASDAKDLRELGENLKSFHDAIEDLPTSESFLNPENGSIIVKLMELEKFLQSIKTQHFKLPPEKKALVTSLNNSLTALTTSLTSTRVLST